jgi:hypothetical protein
MAPLFVLLYIYNRYGIFIVTQHSNIKDLFSKVQTLFLCVPRSSLSHSISAPRFRRTLSRRHTSGVHLALTRHVHSRYTAGTRRGAHCRHTARRAHSHTRRHGTARRARQAHGTARRAHSTSHTRRHGTAARHGGTARRHGTTARQHCASGHCCFVLVKCN